MLKYLAAVLVSAGLILVGSSTVEASLRPHSGGHVSRHVHKHHGHHHGHHHWHHHGHHWHHRHHGHHHHWHHHHGHHHWLRGCDVKCSHLSKRCPHLNKLRSCKCLDCDCCKKGCCKNKVGCKGKCGLPK